MMSTDFQTNCVFLPISILQYVGVGSGTPRIDPELIIKKATTSEIREILVSFYPHFDFDETAKDERALLISIFKKMVAKRLSYVVIPSYNSPPSHFKAPLELPPRAARAFLISSESDIYSDRKDMFSLHGLLNLENGNYRLVAESLMVFIRSYKHLNEQEIDHIKSFRETARDALHDSTSYLQETHESIEGIQLLLREVNLSSKQHDRLEHELRGAMIKLKSRQIMFDRNVEQAGLVSALVEHHENLYVKYRWDFPADTLSPSLKHVDQGGVDHEPHDSKIHAADGESRVAVDNNVSDIANAYEDSLVALHKIVSLLEDAHKAVEVTYLLLNQAELFPIQHEELANSLEIKLATLNSLPQVMKKETKHFWKLVELTRRHLNLSQNSRVPTHPDTGLTCDIHSCWS
ncbi:uncharacterized protein MELLADRAFT_91265 [Melampsora larici-populina 98AG31]|uniref:Uncharacterized protein n=1 Tax=Melampsora larici-populina (strain 98AG31 / pathotype 3-4-7) TaxID=747676 RepID=F4RYF0_MELLP|nr:uncharacterized protein MELLADRAFT_91265 [Melampsora larici-populina 98AG31]EGG02589.1 hypothetical protein MELLADRAFT_91265 [Melampsora larici-populina 98AG31]